VLPKNFPTDSGIDALAKVKKPGQNASGVGLHYWNPSMEREAGDRVGSVFADSGKSPHLFDRAREASVISIHNDACCAVEISRPGVIPETLPGMKHLIFRSARQNGEIGKSTEPFAIVRDHRHDLGLMEHKLRDEDGVRIAALAPG